MTYKDVQTDLSLQFGHAKNPFLMACFFFTEKLVNKIFIPIFSHLRFKNES